MSKAVVALLVVCVLAGCGPKPPPQVGVNPLLYGPIEPPAPVPFPEPPSLREDFPPPEATTPASDPALVAMCNDLQVLAGDLQQRINRATGKARATYEKSLARIQPTLKKCRDEGVL